ncbi:MAG TPA: superoxide dismutase family protein [Acidimicrobiales bacterium]|nr:superoxide dismutase family protein [Acidimicrobiales bacterium]
MVPTMRGNRSLPFVLIAVSALVLGACGDDADEPAGDASQPLAETSDEGAIEVAMVDAEGADVGTVTLTPEDGATRVEAEVSGIEPGFHGFHIHDVGRCEADAPDGPFTTATGHLVGEGGAHGTHDGDLPSLYVATDGSASLAVTLDAFTVDELTADDGAAIMIHAGADNFANIPDRYTSSEAGSDPGPDDMTNSTGDAGGRIACGVVESSGT